MTWTRPATIAGLAREWQSGATELQQGLGRDLAAITEGQNGISATIGACYARQWRQAAREARDGTGRLAGQCTPRDMAAREAVYTRAAAQLEIMLGWNPDRERSTQAGLAEERHHMDVDGARIGFTTCEIRPGLLLVHGPGVLEFTAISLDDARDTMRSLFSKSATRD
jgi:hypothetical protein